MGMSWAEALVGANWYWKNTGMFGVQCNWGAGVGIGERPQRPVKVLEARWRVKDTIYDDIVFTHSSLHLSSSPSYSPSPPTLK